MDIGAAKMADTPEAFDVIVMPNLYGDILSDVAAQIAGSVGLAGSANIGDQCAMFEAIHGSAPRRAGQNLANPSGLLLGAVLMLVHIDQPEVAERVHNAWLRTIEDGIHTYDIFSEGVSKQKVGHQGIRRRGGRAAGAEAEHAEAGELRARGQRAGRCRDRGRQRGRHGDGTGGRRCVRRLALAQPRRTGGDHGQTGGRRLEAADDRQPRREGLARRLAAAETFCTDSFRCRFLRDGRTPWASSSALLRRIAEAGIEIAMTQTLRNFDGKAGFTLAQGQ